MKSILITIITIFSLSAFAAPPKKNVKSKFYNFDAQMIDGERRQPVIIYHNVREKVKFGRLLSLKKSFLRSLFDTHKNRVFK